MTAVMTRLSRAVERIFSAESCILPAWASCSDLAAWRLESLISSAAICWLLLNKINSAPSAFASMARLMNVAIIALAFAAVLVWPSMSSSDLGPDGVNSCKSADVEYPAPAKEVDHEMFCSAPSDALISVAAARVVEPLPLS
jgi:hypothetical protein